MRGPRSQAALGRLRRFVIATSRGPLRPLWALAYRGAAHAAASWLGRGLGVGVYLRGGLVQGEAEYGLSDVDLSVIAPDAARAAEVRRRWKRLAELLEPLGEPVECHHIETRDAVERACGATVFTHGLGGHQAEGGSIRMQERPVRTGQLSNWRLLSGPDLRPPAAGAWPERDRPAVAWLDLQFWWRHAFQLASQGNRAWLGVSCVKLVAEPVRTLLWLEDGTELGSRAEALDHARHRLPDQREAIDHAIELRRGGGAPELGIVVAALAQVSLRIADEIGRRARAAGATRVELDGLDGSRPLPLVDWRARTFEPMPDPVLVPMEGDPADPARLAAASAAAATGVYPALTIGADLMVLPTTSAAAGRMRGVECPVTDPVSFAMLAGRGDARFAELPGWSAADAAERAVRAHALLLASERDPSYWDVPGEGVARLLASARAAFFRESVEYGDPVLALTAQAVARMLCERRPADRATVEEALGLYTAGREQGAQTPPRVLDALQAVVSALPAYASPAEREVPA